MRNVFISSISLFICAQSFALESSRVSGTLARQVIDAALIDTKKAEAIIVDNMLELNDAQLYFLSQLVENAHATPPTLDQTFLRNMPWPLEKLPFHQTLNKRGVEIKEMSPFHKALIQEFHAGKKVLDVGCAYGFITKMALGKGAQVVAVDVEIRHLAVLVKQVPRQYLPNLSLEWCSFPQGFVHDGENFDVIIYAQLLHFFAPSVVKRCYEEAYSMMNADSRLAIMLSSPSKVGRPEVRRAWERTQLAKVILACDLCGTFADDMLFPSYAPDFCSPESVLVHYQNLFFTKRNLSITGFNIDNEGTFCGGCTNGSYIFTSLGEEIDEYCFVIASKKNLEK